MALPRYSCETVNHLFIIDTNTVLISQPAVAVNIKLAISKMPDH